MLLGYSDENRGVVVTNIIGPGPLATHSQRGFSPDADYQQAVLEQLYWESGGRTTYLGDWHTHPVSSPHPSLIDKRTMIRIARTPTSGTTNPVMLILGGAANATTWSPRPVQLVRRTVGPFLIGYRLVPMKVVMLSRWGKVTSGER